MDGSAGGAGCQQGVRVGEQVGMAVVLRQEVRWAVWGGRHVREAASIAH